MLGSQILGFKNASLSKFQPISYGDGNGQVFFTFDWLDFRMEFETTIGQNSLIFVCFETGYHPKFSVFVWRAETASPSIRDSPIRPRRGPKSLV